MSHAASLTTAQQLIARSKTLVNNDLKRICKEEGLTVSGNKPQLQARVQTLIDNAASSNDAEGLMRLRHRLHHHGEAPPADSSHGYPPNFSSPSAASPYEVNGYSSSSHNYAAYPQQNMVQRPRNNFRESPFYKFEDLVLTNLTLEASPSHRQTASRTLQLSNELCSRMKSDASYRLLLFSASEDLGPFAQYDVSFPSQIEVKINGEEVRANFKGLKNKPGSTRPADITELVRKTGGYRNALQITYALTQKKYNVYIYLVRRNSVADLINTIKSQAVFTKQQVIDEMLKKASDPDIVFDSINMSLKDPVSYSTINIPCRSNICTHNQCFDIESFLLLQEQAPTWQCPVCNKTVSFQGLAVDLYVQDILNSVPRGTEQVTIQPNGRWTQANKPDNATPQRNGYSAGGDDDDDDDDDSDDDIQVVEAPDFRVSAIKNEATYTPLSSIRTPPLSSREASTAPRTGSKRTSEVIDLTLSDDDEPVRPTKKVAYSTPNSLPEPSHRYQQPSYGNSSALRTYPSALSQPQSASNQNSAPSSLRLHFHPVSQNHSSSGDYRPTLPRPNFSYQGSGSSSYLSNSP